MKLRSLTSFNRPGWEEAILILLIIVSLIPIWSTGYFLTWDGPCHLYNARVLRDYISSHNVDFYGEYYNLNLGLFPNWFDHGLLVLLLMILPPFLAEKAFLTGYVVLYPLVFFNLIRAIDKKNAFLALLIFPFIYTNAFLKGFYNFSFSIIFFFLIILYWIRNKERFTLRKLLLFSLLFLVLYFTHPLGYFYALVLLFFLTGLSPPVGRLVKKERLSDAFKDYRRKGLIIFTAALPSLLLLLRYLRRKGSFPTPGNRPFTDYLSDLIRINSLVALTDKEEVWIALLSVLFGILFLRSVYSRIRSKSIGDNDAFFLVFLIALFFYFNTPDRALGGFYLKIRLQIFPFLMLIPWFASFRYRPRFKWIVSGGAVVITVALTLVRLPRHLEAGRGLTEYLSVQPFIEDRSTVLPLSFSRRGKTPDGKIIADRNQLFRHALDYIGAEKSLILFDNYEGHFGYFPLSWRWSRDPFTEIGTNEGITHEPPSADILNYRAKTGGDIDYVVTWCLDEEYLDHPATRSILEQLKRGYRLIYSSPNNRAKLYHRLPPARD